MRIRNRYTSVSWSFYDLAQKMTWKAARHKDRGIRVNPATTSQCCPTGSHTVKTNRDRKKHLFPCKNWGYRSNDDRMGAGNLYCMEINPDASDRRVNLSKGFQFNSPRMERLFRQCLLGPKVAEERRQVQVVPVTGLYQALSL